MYVINTEMFRNDDFDPHHDNNEDDYQWYVVLKLTMHEICRIPVREYVPRDPHPFDKEWAMALTLREYFSGNLSGM